jgi:regulator of replication initiation timing
MTENLLVKLEERAMLLLTEIEELRKQVQRLTLENSTFKMEKETHSRKLQDLINLLDSVNTVDNAAHKIAMPVSEAALIQG